MKGAQSFGSLEFSRAEIKQFACAAFGTLLCRVKKKKNVFWSEHAKQTRSLAATNREIFQREREKSDFTFEVAS
jgi:hypothetical protein